MPTDLPRTLLEACRCKAVWALSAGRNGNGLDKAEDDFVKKYEDFRQNCPDFKKSGHASYCHRCDNSYPSKVGGADFTRKQGVVVTNPFEKFPEPIKPRKGPKVPPTLDENFLALSHQRVPLALQEPGAKLEEPPELSVQEDGNMADTEATRALFRELLGMTNGGTAGGRGSMVIPDDIMDSLSGDAAQDSLARDSLIMEMDKVETRQHDPRFVNLDLMEMESGDVDTFLKSARKKIIKRSKPTRKACCSKIGGVLDQIMGPAGGEYLDDVQADDRGKHDPIGDANDAKTFKMVKEDKDAFMDFISKEFFPSEHGQGCALAEGRNGGAMLGESRIQKDYGLLRDRYGLRPGQSLPIDTVHRDYDRFVESKHLVGPDLRLFERIQLFAQAFGLTEDNTNAQQGEDMEPSYTANALSGFMEASGSVNRYKAADAGSGKGSPDGGMMKKGVAGDLSYTTRSDNAEYDTDLMPAKGGGKKTAGQPQSLSTRGKDRGDPIGEDDYDGPQISETASALSNFMESSANLAALRGEMYGANKGPKERNDTRKRLGSPLEKAAGVRKQASAEGQADEGPRYDDNDPVGKAKDKGAFKN